MHLYALTYNKAVMKHMVRQPQIIIKTYVHGEWMHEHVLCQKWSASKSRGLKCESHNGGSFCPHNMMLPKLAKQLAT